MDLLIIIFWFRGVTKLDFNDILVEHAARKKHTLQLTHPTKKASGTLIVDTAIESELVSLLDIILY